jgi:type IV pilus assembly protein PilM
MAASNKPLLACEITPERVIAARATDAGNAVDVVSARTLPTGSLSPMLAGTNVLNGAALRDAIAEAIAAVGTRSRDLIAIIPDSAVRLVLLDFDVLPEKRQDADSVVRFRLKKSLPFDVDQAALSYDVHRNNGTVKVVAAVAPGVVLAEYEAAFREAGYSPGIVLPSMLAALGPVEATQPTLVIKIDPGTTSVAIVQNSDLLLYRTLENPHGSQLDAAVLAEDIYPSLVFFQDNYGLKVERILLGGLASAHDLGAAMEAQTGAHVADLVAASQLTQPGGLPASLLAPVVGALVG